MLSGAQAAAVFGADRHIAIHCFFGIRLLIDLQWKLVIQQERAGACPTCAALLGQQSSAFLVPPPFPTVPHVVGTPNHRIISLLLHNYNFTTVRNHNVNL